MKKIKSRITKSLFIMGLMGMIMLLASACSNKDQAKTKSDKVSIVTTTNVYADIAKNVAGKYGSVQAIIKNSATDPHDFEPTTADAKKLTNANIIVANGLGYDSWMNKLASSVSKKPVLVGEDLMGLKKVDNPHIWYDFKKFSIIIKTLHDNPHIWYDLDMPTKYVNYLVKRLSKLDKKHAAYFKENGDKYLAKIAKVKQIAKSADKKNNKPVFVSEPVFDYGLEEAGYKIGDKEFEEAIENGTDPSPKIINKMTNEIKDKKIAFFVNNTQASSSTVKTFVELAKENSLPVLNVRETIPNHMTYLDWMRENYQNLANISKK
ncbi:zinc ABC transporter substrate-binding protein [Lactobacillus helveticus]|uniref:ABC superfamily ATP binding cassette transporter,binding protein n=1 Tax=Lactobacillus helveticus CIRM-BIA 951 TaxID=1226334 RepID=U6F504_LACHE|nr:zinc ABC transporter substrate-binding protein [Lactobacillus helveticus]MDY0990951.1 zinc ABC transporter substrate-binding protein [Lactobacillus helveticus]MDY1001647.1 zinc ABC transporter substrate-binding protein [Lactobacillus helveticus]MEB2873472.1 zinc ABC transporter substrate-binding protein [Lactobacillus helveticus]NRO17198.1 Manganese-binding lipoprotein MntA [Lactobacillus helveticus]CDI58348.1 ABC superfamily ATP binding cassette transporter,binding protein [Lactobacillus h